MSAVNSAVTAPAPAATAGAGSLQLFVYGLFFTFGGVGSLNDVLIPKLKESFSLSYAQAMLVQSAFFAAYLLLSLPAAALVRRVGYVRAAAMGLLIMSAGCWLFLPACLTGRFTTFLGALFILAAGHNVVQVAANPLASRSGPARSAHSRLTLAQAFNSLGTVVFPYAGAVLFLAPGQLSAAGQGVTQTYVSIALLLSGTAVIAWTQRGQCPAVPASGPEPASFGLLRSRRFALGVMAIFSYVGAEVAIGSVLVNYLMQADTLALQAQAAGKMVALYWAGALLGRFAGAWVLRTAAPSRALLVAASAAIVLLALSSLATGTVSGVALLAVGLVNSIMFPTIFSLTCEGIEKRAAEASGILCMAIAGGAIIPFCMGWVADFGGLRPALLVPALCYAGVALFARASR